MNRYLNVVQCLVTLDGFERASIHFQSETKKQIIIWEEMSNNKVDMFIKTFIPSLIRIRYGRKE